ncbi:MAG: hypothetical protein COV76_05780 [Candidatus Omnitrophica bacterium CG11_big_fil_rev_8_21_14_0_20_64_10]|nr:MAG: hypothetical protein COV76_05780 [Candidatus Omnitrophica bacterium CG11_big_fil_rev_8_21_14_0_20_64_10]
MWQGINQRRFPRFQCACVVTLTQSGKTSSISAKTENLGLGGVCVLLEKGLDVFSPVSVEVKLEDNKPPLQVQGTIVWVVRRQSLKGKTSFDTGIEFSDLPPQSKARLEALIDGAGS